MLIYEKYLKCLPDNECYTSITHYYNLKMCVWKTESRRQKQEDAQRGMNVFILWFPKINLMKSMKQS